MAEKADLGPPPSYDVNQQLQPGQPAPAWQQQPAAPAVAQPANTTVVVQQQPQPVVMTTAAVVPMRMSPYPMNLQCPNCRNTVTTLTYKETGGMVWLAAGLMILFGLWLGCCLIPFCIDSLKDTVHTCPVCKFAIGKHSQL